MKASEIRRQIAELVDKSQELRSKADAESRDLTDEESASIDGWLDDAEQRKSEASQAEEKEKRVSRLDAAVADLSQPSSESTSSRAAPGRQPDTGDVEVNTLTSLPPKQLVAFRNANGVTTNAEEKAAHQSGQFLRAIWGNEDSRRYCRENGIEYRVATEGSNPAGGYLVPEQFSQTIITLLNEWGVARQECQVFPMTRDQLSIPKRNGGVTATWTAEGAAITASDMSWAQVNLNAKSLKVLSRITNELFEDSIVNLADVISVEAANAISEAEDDAWINGDGSSQYGGIVGVVGAMNATEGFASVYTAAAGVDTYGEVTVTDLAGLFASIQQYADRPPGRRLYLSDAGRAMICDRLGQAGGGSSIVTVSAGQLTAYNGIPIVITNKLSNNVADDLSEAIMVLYGNMSQACVFGDRQSISVAVDKSRYFDSDETAVRITERIDVVYHDRGDATTTAAVAGLMGD